MTEQTSQVTCPACQHRYPVVINAAVTLSAHLEDDHRWPLDHVMRVVVEACGPHRTTPAQADRQAT